jgi:alpha/beta hydrolase family protein
MEAMKRGIVIFACLCALSGAAYFGVSKWGIRHESMSLYDETRHRLVPVDLAVRADYEMKANAGFWKLPVAIISNGNTVKNTEYSFLENVLAADGYLVASIQQDIPSDPPLVTRVGLPYVGRLGVYKKGEANIGFVLAKLKTLEPNAVYDHLTLVGHSNGGDIAMYYAQQHPELVSKVITLDNLRVPFVLDHRLKILSFRSKDPNFKTDPGVLPAPEQAGKQVIDIIDTQFQHTDMCDRGPYFVKHRIQATLDEFLTKGSSSELAPAPTDSALVANAGAALP